MQSAGIYLSVPFCRQKCTYCNFASDVHSSSDLTAYIDALQKEIAGRCNLWHQAGLPDRKELRADTLYLGGGTPSLLTPGQLHTLLESVRSSCNLQGGAEVTLEASPETVTPENALAWASCGINRISLGVQSLISQELRAVGRTHDAETVKRAVAALRHAGIDNISADLIAGLPHQTGSSWEATLDNLLEMRPTHVSVYLLEVDDDSRLGSELLRRGVRYGAAEAPLEEQIVTMYTAARDRLHQAGYTHYEISNYALPGHESRHNEKYWTAAPYYGFGVDAHSYDSLRRWANVDSVDTYITRMERGQSPVQEWKALKTEERLEERFFLGLRRLDGIRESEIREEFGLEAQERMASRAAQFLQAGWLERTEDRVRLSDTGVLFSNEVFAGLLGEI